MSKNKEIEITKKELAVAFFHLMDGCNNANEIGYNTGLPMKRCEAIFDLYMKLKTIGEKDNFEFNKLYEIYLPDCS